MRDVAIADRRRLLKRTTLFFAGVAGLGLAGKTGVEAAPAMPIQDTALTMELHGVNWRLVYPDRPRGVLPMRGQRSSSFGELLRGPGKEKVIDIAKGKPPAPLPDHVTLGDIPAAGAEDVGDDPYSALDKLSGEAYEAALERLTPQQKDAYEAGASRPARRRVA